MDGLWALLFMRWNQALQRLALEPHRHTTELNARRCLRLEHNELAACLAHDLSIELHHAVASMQVPAATQRAWRMDLSDDGVLRCAFDRNLLLGWERALPEWAQLRYVARSPDAFGANRQTRQRPRESIAQRQESRPTSEEGQSAQGRLDR